MSNTFGTSPSKREGQLHVSNGATDVLLAVLCLAGTALARNPQHERLVVWLASQDQALMGRGVVGFDLTEMPWERDTFEADRAFLLAAIAAARMQAGWERLAYAPPPDRVLDNLDRFMALLLALEEADVDWLADREPVLGWPEAAVRCPVHGVYESAHGCIICHDA